MLGRGDKDGDPVHRLLESRIPSLFLSFSFSGILGEFAFVEPFGTKLDSGPIAKRRGSWKKRTERRWEKERPRQKKTRFESRIFSAWKSRFWTPRRGRATEETSDLHSEGVKYVRAIVRRQPCWSCFRGTRRFFTLHFFSPFFARTQTRIFSFSSITYTRFYESSDLSFNLPRNWDTTFFQEPKNSPSSCVRIFTFFSFPLPSY